MTLFEAAVGDTFSLNTIYLAQNISQSKFGEVGAGVSFGSMRSNLDTPMLTFTLHVGSNAIPALQGLGVLEAILAKVNLTGPTQRLFHFISGTGDELIYDVSFRDTTSEISSIFNSMLSIAQETLGLESIGTDISQNLFFYY